MEKSLESNHTHDEELRGVDFSPEAVIVALTDPAERLAAAEGSHIVLGAE